MTPQTVLLPETDDDVEYPESDGLPMADNTLQYQWITTIVAGLRTLFRKNANVFVAGDLYWYPVKGLSTERVAPDALVAFGRPKKHRGSYKQWLEGGVPPQVVFEVRSPGNTDGEMAQKRSFYERHGVQEFYDYDPDTYHLEAWIRGDRGLERLLDPNGWVSPLLGIRFELLGDELRILRPDGIPFGVPEDEIGRLMEEVEAERRENARLEQEKKRLSEAREADQQKLRELQQRLRDLGIEP